MPSLRHALLGLAALGTLAACADNRFAADVTRFHLNQPLSRGSVFVVPAEPDEAGSLRFQQFAGEIAAELREVGFTIAPSREAAELVAIVDYEQDTRAAIAERSPVSVGIGGGTFGGNVGVGVGTSFGLGGGGGDTVNINYLAVKLMRKSDETIVWEGRAESAAREGTDNAALSAAIPKLADALFSEYPGPSGQTVTYKE